MPLVDYCLAIEDADWAGVGSEDVLLLYLVPALEFEHGDRVSDKK